MSQLNTQIGSPIGATGGRVPGQRSPETGPSRRGSLIGRAWKAFTRFRRTRPFWGCIVLALGGWFVLRPAVGSFQVMTSLGMSNGAAVYLLGSAMMIAAGVSFVVPAQRHFPALMAAVCSVASLPLANLGGWLIGMVLGIVGSGLVFAWTPYTDAQLEKLAQKSAKKAETKAEKRAAKKAAPKQAAPAA
jgi:hypothetical protein